MLVLKEVSKHYKKVLAVDGISFEVKKGEIFGLIGANGAGKSTTISMIATMLKPDKGDILFQGKSIVKNPNLIRPSLGLVPQDIALYLNLSGLDNLLFWGKAYHIPSKLLRTRISEVCEIIGFTESVLKQRAETYSGGMKRRLNLGAALLHNPQIVILDEPTVGIDMITRNQILNSVKKLSNMGTTIIYTSHYLDEIERLCDTICILDKGKIIANGNKSDLLKSGKSQNLEELYYELLGEFKEEALN
jgi:ABC-2 type transport system ATP-binding protein